MSRAAALLGGWLVLLGVVVALEAGGRGDSALVLVLATVAVALSVAGLLAVVRARLPGPTRVRYLLDGWLCVGSVFAVATQLQLPVPDQAGALPGVGRLGALAVQVLVVVVLVSVAVRDRLGARGRRAAGERPAVWWLGPVREAGPYLVTATGATGVALAALAGRGLDATAAAFAISVLLALVVRQGLTVADNVRLLGELRGSEARFRQLVQGSTDVIMICDGDGRLGYVSPAAEHVFGAAAGLRAGARLTDLVHADDVAHLAASLRRLAQGRGPATRVVARLRASGGWRHAESTLSPGADGVIVTARDVSDRVALQEQLAHLAYHDPLTGLPNRELFRTAVQSALRPPALGDALVGVLFLDLDGFKTVNDSAGHAAGDLVLVEAAARLRGALGPDEVVARLGGDEFAVLLEALPDGRTAMLRARAVAAAFQAPFLVEDLPMSVPASVGVALGRGGDDAAGLLRNADLAMYEAKARGTGQVAPYRTGMLASARAKAEMGARLVQALADEAFALVYQPVVDLGTRRVVAVEALLRARGDGGALLPPDQLVRAAEDGGHIVELGGWVLRTALAQAVDWRAQGLALEVSVNLSPGQVQADGLVRTVADAVADTGLPAELLTLELTESLLLADLDGAVDTLDRLRALGVRLALDDFGTGYSSLSYLTRLPVSGLKLDRGFVAGLARGKDRDDAVAAAVIRLAARLGLQVTAEGIETLAQAAVLRRLGCHRGQGFYFSAPRPAAEIPAVARDAAAVIRTGVSHDEIRRARA